MSTPEHEDTLARERAERIDPDASPRTIEKQLDRKRAEIDRTLDELEQRISPGQMVDRTLGMMRENGGEVFQNLGRSFRDNPMPYLLTGIGLAWAMASQGSGPARYRSRYGYGDERYAYLDDEDGFDERFDALDLDDGRQRHGRRSDLYPRYTEGSYVSSTGAVATGGDHEGDDAGVLDKAREKFDAMGNRIGEAGENLSEKATELGDAASRRYDEMRYRAARQREAMRHRAREAAWRARHGARRGGDAVSDFLHEQPMVAGALGVAVGALIGSLLPASEFEDRYVGEYADETKRRAREQAESGVERAREQTEDGLRQARERVEDGVRQAREKVEETARAAREKSEEGLEKADARAREKEDETREKVSIKA